MQIKKSCRPSATSVAVYGGKLLVDLQQHQVWSTTCGMTSCLHKECIANGVFIHALNTEARRSTSSSSLLYPHGTLTAAAIVAQCPEEPP